MVLRSYDTRFRETTRSPEIYLSKECIDIVGRGAKEILNLTSNESFGNDDSDEFWKDSTQARTRSLQVIVTPYRPGRHYATKPTTFLPVICHLEELHKKGFVHGDIRGFNTVFDEENDQAFLIDFDFGGKIGTREYPKGYRIALIDGKRRVDNKTHSSQNIILPWQDWFALGRLIFEVHTFLEPQRGEGDMQTLRRYHALMHEWDSHETDPTPT